MSDEITISVDDLDALIERKIAQREAAAKAPRRGPTPGCNCAFDGILDREPHQLGCPYADPKGNLAIKRVQEMFG